MKVRQLRTTVSLFRQSKDWGIMHTGRGWRISSLKWIYRRSLEHLFRSKASIQRWASKNVTGHSKRSCATLSAFLPIYYSAKKLGCSKSCVWGNTSGKFDSSSQCSVFLVLPLAQECKQKRKLCIRSNPMGSFICLFTLWFVFQTEISRGDNIFF